jgi:hypothetical protein
VSLAVDVQFLKRLTPWLRWNDLKTHAFSEAESYEMMREAYEGERELASKPKQRADLLKMLGLSPQNKTQSTPKPDVSGTNETPTGSRENQVKQPDDTANGAKQPLPAEEASSEIPSNLSSVQGYQPGETRNEAKQRLPTERTRSEEAPSKPLKKPSRAASQPFRRTSKRDRTGGPHRVNEERD